MRIPFLLLLVLLPRIALGQEKPFTVDDAVGLAVKNNPSLSAVARDVSAARSGVRSARALANPEVTFAPGLTSLSGTGEELLVSQPLELNGTRQARAGIAQAQLRASEAQAGVALLTLVFETKSAYYQLYQARERLALARELLTSAEEFDRIARRQVELGRRAGIETTQTGIEVTRARQQVAQAEAEEVAARALLNTLLGRPTGQTIGTLTLLPPSPLTQDPATAVREAIAFRPEIRAEEAQAEAFRQEARLARAQGLPDLAPQIRVGSLLRGVPEPSSGNGFGVGLAVSLPLFDYGSRRERIRQAEEAARAQVDRATARRNEIGQGVAQALARLKAAEAVLREYPGGLLDQARRLLTASRTGFSEGQTGIITLLEAQRTYRAVQNEYVGAQAAYALARAELERALGSVPASLPQPLTPPARKAR